MADRKRKIGDYPVGYGKPPKDRQFKPGHSGNASGKKPATRGLKHDLEAELSSTLTIQINGQPTKATKQRLMLKTVTARAASGDLKASALLIQLVTQVFGFEDRGDDKRKLSTQDQALLDELIAKSAGTSADQESGEGGSNPITEENDDGD